MHIHAASMIHDPSEVLAILSPAKKHMLNKLDIVHKVSVGFNILSDNSYVCQSHGLMYLS